MKCESYGIESVISAAEVFAHSELEHDLTGHDWWHIQRVVNMSKRLAKEENADSAICTIAALLHDIADVKLNPTKEIGFSKIENWIDSQPLKASDKSHIIDIISTMSYNAGHNPPLHSLEGKIVQDADRLDAIGAIGIARTFLYAGWKGHPIYDPSLTPRDSMTSEEYRQRESTAINHFYEKLLKLTDKMNTDSAKAIAKERHQYMELYLQQFFDEWNFHP